MFVVPVWLSDLTKQALSARRFARWFADAKKGFPRPPNRSLFGWRRAVKGDIKTCELRVFVVAIRKNEPN